MLRNPRLRDVPMAVCGSREERHGIVLTANYIAKRTGVKTAMSIREALAACPGMYIVKPHYNDYIQFSEFTRELYLEYSDRVEAFGLDENWVDLTGYASSFRQGEVLIQEIRERVKRELGITVSVGLADNKVFAKLGSDMRKPDACTAIPRAKFKEIVWPLSVGDLLYVGRATEAKLRARNITTIGELAKARPDDLKGWFGKAGHVLHAFANGEDKSLVAPATFASPVKSVSNSHTFPRDLKNDQDMKIGIYALAESVGARLMELGMYATAVELSYVNSNMSVHATRQTTLEIPTNISGDIAAAAFGLYKKHYSHWPSPLRKIGVKGSNLISMKQPRQLSLFEEAEKTADKEELERIINSLRSRYGNKAVQRAVMFMDTELSGVDAKRDHIIHPVGVFNGGMSESWGGYTTAAKQMII
jgi:DNA polymerase-4